MELAYIETLQNYINDLHTPHPPLVSALDDEHRVFPQVSATFSEHLFAYLKKHDIDDVTLYKKALIDRRHFSKMRDKHYQPTKKTVLRLAFALEMDLAATAALLQTAGFALSTAFKEDIVVMWFINERKYNIFELNYVLAKLKLPTLF